MNLYLLLAYLFFLVGIVAYQVSLILRKKKSKR